MSHGGKHQHHSNSGQGGQNSHTATAGETAHRHQADGASGEQATKDETIRRAEEMVDRVGEQVGQWTSRLGHQLLRFGARAREEAEDMWAEAQDLRRRMEASLQARKKGEQKSS